MSPQWRNDQVCTELFLVAPICSIRGDHRQDKRRPRNTFYDPELQKKLAPLGSYTNPMSPRRATGPSFTSSGKHPLDPRRDRQKPALKAAQPLMP